MKKSEISRFNLSLTTNGQSGMFNEHDGYWVSYSDHITHTRQVLEEAKQKAYDLDIDLFIQWCDTKLKTLEK